MILLKNPLWLFSLPPFRPLADEPEFVAAVHFPLDHLSWSYVDGGSQRQGQVHIALGDAFFTSDGLNLGKILHRVILVN